MNLINTLSSVTRIAGLSGNQTIQITFNPALTPQLRAQIASQPLTLTVSGGNGNQLTFTTPTGATFSATVSPPLPVGTQLQLSVANLLPNTPPLLPTAPSPSSVPTPQDASSSPATPNSTQTTTQPAAGAQSAPIQIQARILPPLAQAVASGTSAPVQGIPPVLANAILANATNLILPATTTTTPVLQNLIVTTLLQQAAATAQPQTPPSTLPVPAGPVAASLPATLPASLIGEPLILTPTAPILPNGTQQANLVPVDDTSAAPVPVTLNLGIALPVARPQQAILLPAILQPESSLPASTQPTLLLTGVQNTPAIPTPPPTGLQIQTPGQPAATIPPTSQQTAATPAAIPVAARVLPPQPTDAPGTQTALLATGATVVLKSPQPLPTGSIIVADLPITTSNGIQRVFTADSQSQAQPNLAQQTQTAAAVTPHTTQAVLAPGMVIQGKITGQNEQGQPLLTITQPGALAGQTVPLTMSDNTALLPIGAQLSIRVENNLAATILTLILPPQTQSAYTVGTLGGRWEGLQQALSVLQQQAPAQAANLRASLPQLSNLMPGLIAFTNALRTNDPDDIFDAETTRLLKSMGIDLSSDISQLSQLQQRPATNSETQWRGTLFPYVEAPNEDPRQGGFFWRREKSDNPRAPTNTRFVVEVEMSQMGPMQLDGLVTYPEIWLKLRRTSTPEPGFTEGLQTLVNSLLESSGLQGGIAVETTPAFTVNPRAELLAQTENPLPTSA